MNFNIVKAYAVVDSQERDQSLEKSKQHSG